MTKRIFPYLLLPTKICMSIIKRRYQIINSRPKNTPESITTMHGLLSECNEWIISGKNLRIHDTMDIRFLSSVIILAYPILAHQPSDVLAYLSLLWSGLGHITHAIDIIHYTIL